MRAIKGKTRITKDQLAKCENCGKSNRPLIMINGSYVCKPCSRFFTPGKKTSK